MAGRDEVGPSSEPSKDLVTSADERLRDSRKRLERAGKSQREPETRNIFFFVAKISYKSDMSQKMKKMCSGPTLHFIQPWCVELSTY